MNNMGSDGKGLGNNGQGIKNPIKVCVIIGNQVLGYEGRTCNRTINFMKENTLIMGESSKSHSSSNAP
jgi:hypothetical protein